MRTISLAACALVLLWGQAPAFAQDAHKKDPAEQLAEDMNVAVTKGVRWLLSKQRPDGEWGYDNAPLQLGYFPMKSGVTALCVYALMKCGVNPSNEPIRRAFAFIHKEGFKYTYEVGCILLALEARANFDPNRKPIQAPGNPYGGTKERGPRPKKVKRVKPPPADRKLAQQCVNWLVANQRDSGLWRYVGAGGDEDVSNAQYAMLGLDAAERMGIKVPSKVYEKAAKRLIEIQKDVSEKDKGKVVEPFPIPGADMSYAALKKIEAALMREIKKIDRKFKKVAEGEAGEDGLTRDQHVQTAERKIAEKLSSKERAAFQPRGWQYFPPNSGGSIRQRTTTGSLTCSAIAALFICKARLEASSRWRPPLSTGAKKSIRDGCAWMALHFTVAKNPELDIHHLYYIYGLERAGVLGLIHRFGKHEWFDLGARLLTRKQNRKGYWMGSGSTSGKVPDTCFALLFLSKGTTPVVRIPGRVMTGVDRKY